MLPTTIPWDRIGGGMGAPLVLTGVRVGLDILWDASRNGSSQNLSEKNLLRVVQYLAPWGFCGEKDVID